jgi:hypothetical protein
MGTKTRLARRVKALPAKRAALIRLGLGLVVCAGIVLFASATEASNSDRVFRPAQLGLGQAALARSALARERGAPSFALAARNGVKQLIGLGGPSPVAQETDSGLWGGHTLPNWWESALALLAEVRYLERTHNTQQVYQRSILKLYTHNVVRPNTHAPLNFGNEFNDDTGWWGVAWLEAARYELYVRHDLVHATKFLNVAEWDADFIASQDRRCGGIEWGLGKPPDTITTAEFLSLTAGLYSLRNAQGPFHNASKAAHWRADTNWAWRWFRHSNLINVKTGRVYDKLLGGSCKRWGGPLTYSEGWTAEALVRMGVAYHNKAYFRDAQAFLRYAVAPSDGLVQSGVFREKCEAAKQNCQDLRGRLDIPSWKGLLVSALSDWTAVTGKRTFVPVIRAQANAVVNNAILGAGGGRCSTAATCLFGGFWIPPRHLVSWAVGATVAAQESAIDALTSALPSRNSVARRP